MKTLHYLAEGLTNKGIAINYDSRRWRHKIHAAAASQVLQASGGLDEAHKARQLELITLAREDHNGG